MKPSREEISKEIEQLKQMKPNVRNKSMFGDDHHEAIDAQIEVLKERLDTDEIYDQFEDGESNVLDSAVAAREWMDGENDDAPSVGWKELLIGGQEGGEAGKV